MAASSVLRSDERVCGSGPRWRRRAATTPSTMDSPRSTSPPKSEWPGVSMMLSWPARGLMAVFLARMVMPFSRSRSLESHHALGDVGVGAETPHCHSIASTSVVLPW